MIMTRRSETTQKIGEGEDGEREQVQQVHTTRKYSQTVLQECHTRRIRERSWMLLALFLRTCDLAGCRRRLPFTWLLCLL
jgi:hypothetical protein